MADPEPTPYADSTRIQTLLNEYKADLGTTAYSSLETEGITRGDAWVTRYIKKKLPDYAITGMETAVIDASTLYSASLILITINTNRDKDSPAVKSWQDEAKECLDDFIDEQLEEEDEPDPTINPSVAYSIYFD